MNFGRACIFPFTSRLSVLELHPDMRLEDF